MTLQSEPSEARTPAYGLRVSADADNFIVRALDSSGRGRPLKALVVPVKQQDDRFERKNRQCLKLYDVKWPRRRFSRELSKKKPVPDDIITLYSFKVPRSEWPSSSSVLVFLLYDQSEGVGGNPRPPRSTGDKSIGDLVKEALKHENADALCGGLIRCRQAGFDPGRPLFDESQRVTFALASCQYPSDMFNRMPEAEHATPGPVDRSLLALGDRLNDESDPPTLLLLCGDQIYTDATAGLFDPKVSDQKYRIPHERRGQSRGSMAVVQRADLEVQMMLDDHEIRDNWAPNDPEPEELGSGKTAIEFGKLAYFRYERGLRRSRKRVWHQIKHKGFPFFLGDTRTEREGRTASNWRTAQIMHKEQFDALCIWLVDDHHKNRPKFVLTASALLPRRLQVTEQPASALHSDAWEGYPASMHDLLAYICDKEIKGVVFLSGDDHVSNVVKATVTRSDGRSCTLHSIHSSALYAPYPFANDMRHDFKGKESFCFKDRYRCEVKTLFVPDDGFAVLTARIESSRWYLDVDFYNTVGERKNDTVKLDLGLLHFRSNRLTRICEKLLRRLCARGRP